MQSKTILSFALSLALACSGTARAHSEASAVSVAAPVFLLSAGVTLTVVAVQASATGTVWVLERASDGARMSVRVSTQVVGGVSVLAGTSVLVAATAAGWVLSVAGEVIAFVPNELGRALLHNEQVTK
jgi:hypothetical protein